MWSQHDIENGLRKRACVRWVPASQILMDRHEACVDGRSDIGIIGTPGGNAGELLLLLAAIEATGGTPFTDREIQAVFERYLKTFGDFYMHSDLHALEELPEAIQAQVATDPEQRTAAAWTAYLTEPDPRLHGELLDRLSQPQTTGCGHLKLMLNDPEGYRVRRALTRGLMQAFYRALWRGEDLAFVVLDGHHDEQAVVNVTVTGDHVDVDTHIPTIAPRAFGGQMFINHPQAIGFLRDHNVRDAARITGRTIDATRVRAAIDEIATAQLGLTLSALASGLPIYTLAFEPDGGYAIDKVGVV